MTCGEWESRLRIRTAAKPMQLPSITQSKGAHKYKAIKEPFFLSHFVQASNKLSSFHKFTNLHSFPSLRRLVSMKGENLLFLLLLLFFQFSTFLFSFPPHNLNWGAATLNIEKVLPFLLLSIALSQGKCKYILKFSSHIFCLFHTLRLNA